MPSVDETLGALLIATILSSIVYGITLLQVYSYYNSHSSSDRWPLKCFVAFLTLVDSVNVVFVSHSIYFLGVTNFGDYSAFLNLPWSFPAMDLSAVVLEVCVQHFYAYRIYLLRSGSPYLPAAISIVSLTKFGVGFVLGVKGLEHKYWQGNTFRNLFISTLSCEVLCNVLVTLGMVYTLLSNRTRVRRTNTVLNLLAIYIINCGMLNLVLSIFSMILFAQYRNALIYTAPTFLGIRLYFCAFMSILNSRSTLRETLNGSGHVVTTLTQLTAHRPSTTTAQYGVQVTKETSKTSSNRVASESLPQFQVSYYTPFTDIVTLDNDKFPVSPAPAVMTV